MLSVHAPHLARAHLTDLLRGAERWCQGFSEPDAGSDLASLRTKAVRDGDDWIVDGHKIWTSQATVSQRCVVLLRTGTPESRHRGLSMMLVDHDTPGVEVARSARCRVATSWVRCCSTARVARRPAHRRATATAGRWRCTCCSGSGGCTRGSGRRGCSARSTRSSRRARRRRSIRTPLADAYLSVLPMRLSAAHTIRSLAAGETPGPEVSVDKVLLARAELAVFDLVDTVLDGAIELDDDQRGAGDGGTSTCSAARRRSTAVPTRSSARSWPTGCSGCPVGEDATAIDRDALDTLRAFVARRALAQPDVDVDRRARADRLARLPRRRPGVGGAAGVRAARRAPAREHRARRRRVRRARRHRASSCAPRAMRSRTRGDRRRGGHEHGRGYQRRRAS